MLSSEPPPPPHLGPSSWCVSWVLSGIGLARVSFSGICRLTSGGSFTEPGALPDPADREGRWCFCLCSVDAPVRSHQYPLTPSGPSGVGPWTLTQTPTLIPTPTPTLTPAAAAVVVIGLLLAARWSICNDHGALPPRALPAPRHTAAPRRKTPEPRSAGLPR